MSDDEVVAALPAAADLLREVEERWLSFARDALSEKRRRWRAGTLAAIDDELAKVGRQGDKNAEFHLMRERRVVEAIPDLDPPKSPEARAQARTVSRYVSMRSDAGNRAVTDASIDRIVKRLGRRPRPRSTKGRRLSEE